MKRFSRVRKILIRAAAVLVILLPAIWWFENYRGAWAWERAKKEVEKVGAPLTRGAFLPPELPDDGNLLLNPIFAAEFEKVGEGKLTQWRDLFEWNYPMEYEAVDIATGETFRYASFFSVDLTEEEARAKVFEAATDFETRLDVLSPVLLAMPDQSIFARNAATLPLSASMADSNNFSGIVGCYASSAMMAIRMGDPEKALERMKVVDRLRQFGSGPFLFQALYEVVRMRQLRMLLWEGLRVRIWTDDHLRKIADIFKGMAPKAAFMKAFRFELAWGLEVIDDPSQEGDLAEPEGLWERILVSWYMGGPAGWNKQRKAVFSKEVLFFIEVLESGELGRLTEPEPEFPPTWSPFLLAATGPWSGMPHMCHLSVEAEIWRRMTLAVVQLERYFLDHQKYPDDLAAIGILVEDLAYKIGQDGRPVLWSRREVRKGTEIRWQYFSDEK